jgi:serine/threonine protein kinase
MPTGRSEQVKELFESIRECSPEERQKTLEPVRARDPQLCKEVEALLQQTKTLPLGPAAFQDLDPLEGPPPSLLDQRYRLERLIGRGGFGIVYLARDERLHDKPVVVKFLIGETRRDEWFRKKFRDEIEALSRLDHPGIVRILDAGQTPGGTPYLVMQYVEGVTLRPLIVPGGIELDKSASIVQQIGQALTAAHLRGVFHRDLKPENIMVWQSPEGEFVRLIDFGIATIREQGFERAAEPTRVAGSLAYMPDRVPRSSPPQ